VPVEKDVDKDLADINAVVVFIPRAIGVPESLTMTLESLPRDEAAHNLALALVASSDAPLLLLGGDLAVVSASKSFCRAFRIDPADISGREIFALGKGEWDAPRLRSLLSATLSGAAKIDSYEMDLRQNQGGSRRLVLKAEKLSYGDSEQTRLLLTIADVTEARIAERAKETLLGEKAVLLLELQHRVANSLQIIASVLMMSARKVQSEETRGYLHDAHHRVMSIAALQQQLAASSETDVNLRSYFTRLCESLGASMIHDPDQIKLDVHVDESAVAADVSVSLGLIVTELVINALKHAFPGDRAGKIMVDYQSNRRDWTMSVSDDGVGIPADAKDAPAGLGTVLVQALAKQLQAEVATANANPGTTVSVVRIDPVDEDEPPADRGV
jgi:two-component system, sensor histidine kinase PdtaS